MISEDYTTLLGLGRGGIGGFGANHHLRQSLTFVNVPTIAQPEAFISGATKLFDDQGKLVNDPTKEFLKNFMEAFEKWVHANAQQL